MNFFSLCISRNNGIRIIIIRYSKIGKFSLEFNNKLNNYFTKLMILCSYMLYNITKNTQNIIFYQLLKVEITKRLLL